MAQRTLLLSAIGDIDAQISEALRYPASKRAAKKAKDLFWLRDQVSGKLLIMFGIDVDDHPALSESSQ